MSPLTAEERIALTSSLRFGRGFSPAGRVTRLMMERIADSTSHLFERTGLRQRVSDAALLATACQSALLMDEEREMLQMILAEQLL